MLRLLSVVIGKKGCRGSGPCSGHSCLRGCSCHCKSRKRGEGCHALLDTLGRHRASCTQSGRVKKRSTPIERVVGRIFREAGAGVRQNVFLKDMNVQVAAEDARRIEVLAQDLPCYGGAQLAIDVTLRGVLTAQGEAQPHAADWDEKENTYRELVCSGRCKFVVARTLERRSGAGVEATFLREGSRSSVIHARPSGLDVGTKVDTIARSGVCNIICSFAGRPCEPCDLVPHRRWGPCPGRSV